MKTTKFFFTCWDFIFALNFALIKKKEEFNIEFFFIIEVQLFISINKKKKKISRMNKFWKRIVRYSLYPTIFGSDTHFSGVFQLTYRYNTQIYYITNFNNNHADFFFRLLEIYSNRRKFFLDVFFTSYSIIYWLLWSFKKI